jgi:hypothetical protein
MLPAIEKSYQDAILPFADRSRSVAFSCIEVAETFDASMRKLASFVTWRSASRGARRSFFNKAAIVKWLLTGHASQKSIAVALKDSTPEPIVGEDRKKTDRYRPKANGGSANMAEKGAVSDNPGLATEDLSSHLTSKSTDSPVAGRADKHQIDIMKSGIHISAGVSHDAQIAKEAIPDYARWSLSWPELSRHRIGLCFDFSPLAEEDAFFAIPSRKADYSILLAEDRTRLADTIDGASISDAVPVSPYSISSGRARSIHGTGYNPRVITPYGVSSSGIQDEDQKSPANTLHRPWLQ